MAQTSNALTPLMNLHETQFQFGRLIQEINHKLITDSDEQKIFDFMFDSLDKIIPYDRIGIAMVEGEGNNQICSKWVKSNHPPLHLGPGYCASLRGSSLQNIFETGQPRIINDLIQYASEHPQTESTKLILNDGIRSNLACPLYLNNKPLGIVFFSSRKTDTYKDEHIQTYLEIAEELSLIVERNRLRNDFQTVQNKSQNLRMILHDLKSPLCLIQGFLEVARDEDWYQCLAADAKNIFSILQRNTNYMFSLVNELSELKQMDFMERTPQKKSVKLREFIAELAMSGRETADRKEIRFSITTEPGLPQDGCFDPIKVRRIFDNLITNAVKYSQRRTHIQVLIGHKQDQLIFEISDQGQGIPESELQKLFREFGKTSVRPTEGEPSTGLGLAIAKKAVEQCGGRISARSQVGRGSTFSFWLPLHETPQFT